MRKWIQVPHREGVCSRQAHADLPAEGIYERELGRSGFFGPSSHIHHRHPPTGWTDWEGELRPRAFDLNKLAERSESPWQAPVILENHTCQMRMWSLSTQMDHLVRNADGDQLLFVHAGKGELFCDYGHLSITDGDYITLPRGTLWRIAPVENLSVLMIEATDDSFQLPEKGILGDQAIFDPTILDYPKIDQSFLAQQDENSWQVEIKRHNKLSRVTFPFNPLDAVGWHGSLMPIRINWRDIRPLMSHRYHLPPSVHSTFVAGRFVVCTFVPRPIESDPGALKVPFYHSNEDYDEVIFYHAGDFFSRDNIEPGMLSFHPAGFTHGPHPKAFKAGLEYSKKSTDEVAVMVDTRDPLEVSTVAETLEFKGYVDSWKHNSTGS